MSWVLYAQIVGLMLLTYILVVAGGSSMIDKRRQDAYHRKENGL